MAKQSHTPGPWKVRHDNRERDGLWELVGFDIESESGEEIIGREGIEAWKDNAEANTRLIAAAPELLEALKACASVCAGESMSKRGLIGALEMARAAIAKATGEQQ